MKIIWVTNVILPYPAHVFNLQTTSLGGWIKSALELFYMDGKYEIAIATLYSGNEIKKCIDHNISYFLIPGNMTYKYDKDLESYCKTVLNEFNPDIIHLHGSEFPHGLAFINSNKNSKIILSMQGIISVIGRNYLSGLSYKDILKNITIRDLIRNDNLFQQQKKFIKRGKYEKQIFNRVDAIIGRTQWDKSVAYSINSSIRYFINNETLRSGFYENSWDINKIEKYSIYISQASYPLKGFHIFLNALAVVKIKYPSVKVYVAGANITDLSGVKQKVKLSGYGKILINLIKKLKLEDTVYFLGLLDERQTVERMLKSNITVIPSILENSSNSLCEAMLLGVPSISAYTGGTPSIVKENCDGLLYSYFDYEVLASKIISLFEDNELCLEISRNSKKNSIVRHDKHNNHAVLCDIYEKLMKE